MTVMLKRGHDLHALAFLTLYLYSIFAQIGYAYFPELSQLYDVYYGPSLFYAYWFFMFFSFVLTFLLYLKLNPIGYKKHSYIVKSTRRNYGEYLFFSIAILLYLALNLYFRQYRELFGYGGGTPMGGPWFGIGFWMYTLCNLILYTLFRDTKIKLKKRIFSLLLFIIYTLFFLQVTIASGVRSSILYFFISIFFYEFFPMVKTIKYNKRKILVFILGSFLLLDMLSSLRNLRIQGEDLDFSSLANEDQAESMFEYDEISTAILLQDYYLPSHTLFASIEYKIIVPLDVIKSNLANSLVGLDYPFLTITVVERATGITDERGGGWAYHYFVEGFNAMGFLGVFYNAVFWNLGMLLWLRLGQSNNSMHNKVILSFSALVIMMVMRSQTSAFIQFYWLILLSGSVLLLLANNSTIAFINRKKSLN
jgi:hypothetical protein